MGHSFISNTKESARYTLEQVNTWINSIDTKASYALSVTSILSGFILIQGMPQAFSAFCAADRITVSLLLGAILVVSLYLSSYAAIILLVSAIIARITSKSKNRSHLFFGHISKVDLSQYIEEFTELSEEQYVNELIEQIHINSQICIRKIWFYQKGIYTLIIAVSLCFICCLFQLI